MCFFTLRCCCFSFQISIINKNTLFIGIFTYFSIFSRNLFLFFRILQIYRDLQGIIGIYREVETLYVNFILDFYTKQSFSNSQISIKVLNTFHKNVTIVILCSFQGCQIFLASFF